MSTLHFWVLAEDLPPHLQDSQHEQPHRSSFQSKNNLPVDIFIWSLGNNTMLLLPKTKTFQFFHFVCHQIQAVSKFRALFLKLSLFFYFAHHGCNSSPSLSCVDQLFSLHELHSLILSVISSCVAVNEYSSSELQMYMAHLPLAF